jgi:mRNA-degrading endonuclease YafQ of YafQ-DinJ toxin-antitoxin module
VKSVTLPVFWRLWAALSEPQREQARKAYRLFTDNPAHPSLRFKPLQGWPDYWSVRVSLDVRAVGRRAGDTITWFWIGTHNRFDKTFG